MRIQVRFLVSLSGLTIQHCHELWYWSQMQLGSHAAVAVCRPVATALIQLLAWEPLYAMGAALKDNNNNKKLQKSWTPKSEESSFPEASYTSLNFSYFIFVYPL